MVRLIISVTTNLVVIVIETSSANYYLDNVINLIKIDTIELNCLY